MADGGSGAVRRLSALRESVYGAISGAVYGAAAVATAHPFDTIKTQQQSARGTVARGPLATARAIVHAEGALRGLYRGFAPALSGSVLFRSLPFVGYSASTAYLSERSAALRERPVALAALGGACGGALRSVAECPLELIKTRRQAGNPWSLWQWVRAKRRGGGGKAGGAAAVAAAAAAGGGSLYTGIALTTARNSLVIGLFWAFVEGSKEWRDAALSDRHARAFAAGAGCSALAWGVSFPLDVLKSHVQSGNFTDLSARGAAAHIYGRFGLRGFYAGLGAGLARSTFANGVAFTCYAAMQDWLRAAEEGGGDGAGDGETPRGAEEQ
jgi:solute carrier family 25 carnitine/acylcarnitine transporter 20/29